jgi:hypothetical protein
MDSRVRDNKKQRWLGAPGRFRLDAVDDSGLLADEGLALAAGALR